MARDTSDLEARKEPRQERSRQLVAAILEGARQILRTDGLEALTVQSVCDRAGVAPGSMYQYYPSKEAVCYALLREHAEQVTLAMTGVLTTHRDAPVEVLVAEAVSAFIGAHRDDCRVHAELGVLVAREAGPGLEDQVMNAAERVLQALIAARSAELPGIDPAVVAFLLARTLESTVHAAARDAPELLRSADFEAGLNRMLLGLLRTVPGS